MRIVTTTPALTVPLTPLSFFCRPNGVTFIGPPGTAEFLKSETPKAGDIVSFKHRGFLFGSNKPKLPTLYRIRTDITWEEVVNNWKEKTPVLSGNIFLPSPPPPNLLKFNFPFSSDLPIQRSTRTCKPKGYWLQKENRVAFFEEFAHQYNFDPYVADNWTAVAKAQVLAHSVYTTAPSPTTPTE